jgi:hypothetical protein
MSLLIEPDEAFPLRWQSRSPELRLPSVWWLLSPDISATLTSPERGSEIWILSLSAPRPDMFYIEASTFGVAVL